MTDEYKIKDPDAKLKNERDRLKKQLNTARSIEFAIKVSLIEKNKNLDIDNIFHVCKGEHEYCTLTGILPCHNPHCMSCHMPLFKEEEAQRIMDYIGECVTQKFIRKTEKMLSEDENKLIEEIIEEIEKIEEKINEE